jgi:diguanylate cyclase (GGDEF)-like protein
VVQEWQSYLREKIQEIKSLWLTRAEFQAIVLALLDHTASPLAGLELHFTFEAPFLPFSIGRPGTGEPNAKTHPLNDNRQGTCHIKWWLKPGQPLAFDLEYAELVRLLEAWWKPDLRTRSAGLPDLKRATVAVDYAMNTVAYDLQRGKSSAVLFCDLDNFGQVNKSYGHEIGDRVIREFAALAEARVEPFGVLLHDGGDELVVLCPGGGAIAAVRAAYAVREAVASHDFGVPEIRIGLSSGLAATDAPKRSVTFEELKEEANRALIQYAKKPNKGCARFDVLEGAEAGEQWEVSDYAALNKALVISAAVDEAPFANVWMDALSATVAGVVASTNLSLERASAVATDFIDWIKMADVPTMMLAGNPPSFVPTSIVVRPTASALGLAFAVAHGVLRSMARAGAGSSLTVRYSRDGLTASLGAPDGSSLWSSHANAICSEVCQISLPMRDEADAPGAAARAILIKIGHSPLPVPACLFAAIIVIDDRPTRGGCLPDFWQLTLSRLVALLQTDPNIRAVFVVGDHQFAAETVQRLKNVDHWTDELEDMAHRLSVTNAALSAAAERLHERVHFPPNYRSLVHTLARELDAAPALKSRTGAGSIARPILDRAVEMGSMALQQSDGCRVETAQQAFPLMLEIIRKANPPLIRDQAGQTLRELIDFKVHVLRPAHDIVPDYYRGQEPRMDQYFRSAFLDPERFFGRAFNLGSQFDTVVNHVAAVITQGNQVATRRAILIIAHESVSAGEWTPLGLVSVRVIPRFHAQGCELSFSFTWRTVEALVGFPYSLYGSARFGQHLVELVRRRLSPAVQSRVTMGYLSYVAHSLHMFMDEFGQAIVRRIVNDATR